MEDRGVEVSHDVNQQMRAEESAGCTVICVAGGDKLLGIAAVSDKLKPEAIDTIEALHKLGKDVYLITGDNRLCGNAVAKEAGIPQHCVRAEVTPAGKKAEVSINDEFCITNKDFCIKNEECCLNNEESCI